MNSNTSDRLSALKIMVGSKNSVISAWRKKISFATENELSSNNVSMRVSEAEEKAETAAVSKAAVQK